MAESDFKALISNYTNQKQKVKDWIYQTPTRLSNVARAKNDAAYRKRLSPQDQHMVSMSLSLFPDLFKGLANKSYNYLERPTPSSTVAELAAKKQQQLLLTQGQKPVGAGFQSPQMKAMSSGNYNDWLNKTSTGFFAEGQNPTAKFGLGMLNLFPRMGSAALGEGAEIYKEALQTDKPKNTIEAIKTGFKTVGNADNFKRMALSQVQAVGQVGEYGDSDYAKSLKKIFPNTKFTTNYKWTEDQNDWVKGTNWIQKVGGAIAGSPADITGFALDVLLDPLTYLTGGVGKAAKIGTLADDLLVKGGTKLLPKGAELFVTKAGQKLIQQELPEALRVVEKIFAKELESMGYVVGEKMTGVALRFAEKKAAEIILRNAAKTLTKDGASKLIEMGGAKLFGQTIKPGYEFAQSFGKKFTGGNIQNKFLKGINNVFNPFAQTANQLKPLESYIQSVRRTRLGGYMKKAADILAPLTREQRDVLQKYAIITRDIARYEGNFQKLAKQLSDEVSVAQNLFPNEVVINKVNTNARTVAGKILQLKTIISELNIDNKMLEAHGKLTEFFDDLYKLESSKIGKYHYTSKYFPVRYGLPPTAAKKVGSELGPQVAAFEKWQTQDYLAMMKQGTELKPLEETITKRITESAVRTARADMLEEIKQYGSMMAREGWTEATDFSGKAIKELQGWYFPKELDSTFKKTYEMFFGEKAMGDVLKAYDRILTIWKRLALATPGYHFRNFYSDVFSGMMEYGFEFLNPKHWLDDLPKLLKNKSITFNGKTTTLDELTEAGVKAGQYVGEGAMKPAISQTGKWNKFAAGFDKAMQYSPVSWSMKIGSERESMGRLVAAMIELKNGNSLIDAAWKVNKVFFDYTALTKTEKIFKKIIPFYTWWRKNIQRQFELILTKTGRYSGFYKLGDYIENVAATRYGQEYVDEYNKNKPAYYGEIGAKITGAKSNAGEPLVLAQDIPAAGLLDMTWRQVTTSLAPIIKMAIELPMKKEFFSGKEISSDSKPFKASKTVSAIFNIFPTKFLEKMGMTKDPDGNVGITSMQDYMMRAIPTLYTASRMLPADETGKTPLDRLSTLLGIKFYNFNLGKAKESKNKAYNTYVDKEIDWWEFKTKEEMPTISQIESVYKNLLTKSINEKYGITTDDGNTAIQQFNAMLNMDNIYSEEELKQIAELKKQYQNEISKLSSKDMVELIELLNEYKITTNIDDIIKINKEK